MTHTSDACRESARGNGVADAGTAVPIDSLRQGDRVDMRQVIEAHIDRAD
ncbi:hypothetical protein [Pseudoclavibacter sp. JAI123]|nr:hypothetical protein [Pseudoclavibacter sp. JAI123]